MPAEDVSDLRDVVDAINRLCETMKTSGYEETEYEDCTDETCTEEVVEMDSGEVVTTEELVSPEEVAVREVDAYVAERWSEAEPASALSCDLSEVYYSACSEASLVSAAELPEERRGAAGAAAGHVAAMRERFESMTRANTPCPDLARSLSPAPAPAD